MSNKNVKNNKKNRRNNYKIESLEPRLMMDGDSDDNPTILQWMNEVEKFDDSYLLMNLSGNSFKNKEIDGLFVAKEDSLEQATYGSLLEIRADAKKWTIFSKPLAEQTQVAIDAVKTDLKNRIRSLHVDSIKTPAAEIVAKLGSEEKTVPTGLSFQTTTYGIELFEGDKIKVNFLVNLEISSVPGLEDVNEFTASVLDRSYKADSSKILGLEADYRFRRYSELYQASFILDGNALNGVDKESSLSLMVEFDEKAGDFAKYGVLEFNGDSDSDADLVLGAKITKTKTDTLFESFSKADFDLSIKNPEQFSDDTSEKVFENENSVTLKKDYGDVSVKPVWSDSSIEKYNDITMGKILGKLQELSSQLSKLGQEGKENKFNFGGILASNTNALLDLSPMIVSVLKRCPQSLQELVECFKNSDFTYQIDAATGMKIAANPIFEKIGDELKLHLDFYIDGNNADKIDPINKSKNVFDVSLSTRMFENEMNLDVLANDCVKIVSNVLMSFDLMVPLEGPAKAESETTIGEIGLNSTDEQIGAQIAGYSLIGNPVLHQSVYSQDISGLSKIIESAKEYNSTTYVNRSAYYRNYSSTVSAESIVGTGYENVSAVYGYVLSVDQKQVTISNGSVNVLADKTDELSYAEAVASVLNSFFTSQETYKIYVTAIDKNVLVWVDKSEKLTSELETYLNSFTGLKTPICQSGKKEIWISKCAAPTKYDVTKKINVLVTVGSEKQNFSLPETSFAGVTSVADIASVLQYKIDCAFNYGNESGKERNLFVETVDGRLIFRSKDSFSVDFKEAKTWLGLSSSIVEQKPCMTVVFEDHSSFDVDLSSLLSSTSAFSGIKIKQVLNEIANQSSGKVYIDGVKLKTVDSANGIEDIKDINGYHFASLLGLTEKDEDEEFYSVNASLVNDPNDARLENFYLDIANVIDDGNVDGFVANYGVYGTRVTGDLSGAGIYTRYVVNSQPGPLNLEIDDAYSNCSGGDKCLNVTTPSVDIKTDDNEILAYIQLEESVDYNHSISWILVDGTSYDTLFMYGPCNKSSKYPGLTMETVYDGLYNVVSEKLMNFFFSNSPNQTFLEKFELPLQGKSVLDLMGLRGKINEMAKCLNQGNGSTLQELKQFFEDKLGVYLDFKLTSSGLGIDLTWNKVIQNQATELGGMDFGLEGFNLGGSVEAYLNLNLTLHAHIDIVYDSNTNAFSTTLFEDAEKTYVDGFVYFTAENVVTDLNVCVTEKDGDNKSNYEKLFQIGDNTNGTHSRLFMLAEVKRGYDETYRQIIDVNIGGELFAYRYGIYSGCIRIGVAKKNNDYNDLSCWENGLDDQGRKVGYIRCENNQELHRVAVWDHACDGNVYKSNDAIKTGDIVVNLTKLEEPLKETVLFEKLRQVADGLSDTLRRLQSNLNSVLIQKNVRSIPLVGDSILGAADSLSELYTKLIEPFRRYVEVRGGYDARSVAQAICSMLGGTLEKLGKPANGGETWAGVKFTDDYNELVQYVESNGEVCWRMRLKGSYDLETNKGFDLGFAGLGLKTEGGVDINFDWTLDIGFGISNTRGAFLLLSNGSEVDEASVSAEKVDGVDDHAGDDFKATLNIKANPKIHGSLGFLAMDGVLKESDFVLKLGIDLNDGDNSHEAAAVDWKNDKKSNERISFSGIKSGLSVEAGFRGQLHADINLSLGIGGYEKTAPHIDTGFKVYWDANLGTSEFGRLTQVAFTDIIFDAGSFVNDTIGSVVEKINKVIDPIRPLIDFLQSDIPVLNKLPLHPVHITVLDLIKKYGDSKGMNFGFLDNLIELTTVVDKFDKFARTGVQISNGWVLVDSSDSSRRSLDTIGLQFLNGKVSNIDKYVSDNIDKFGWNANDLVTYVQKAQDYINNIENVAGSAIDYAEKNVVKWDPLTTSDTTTIKTPSFSASWEFPLFNPDSAPAEIMKLLMGGHADLIKMDMAPLEFKFDWSKSFPIVGPLCADIGFGFGVSIDLCFGYDTYGLESWFKSGYKNSTALLNGFYMSDWVDGKDVPEIVFHSSVSAGASVCGRAGINVGLNLNLNLDFVDPNYDGKIRLSELSSMVSFNPLDTFDISATMEVKAYAYLDYFIGRKEWALWSSGAIELFSTASSTNRAPNVVTDVDGDTVVNVGEYAEYRSTGYVGDLPDVVDITFDDAHNATISLGYTENGDDVTYATKKCCVKGTLYVYAGEHTDKIFVKGTNISHNIIVYGGEGDDLIDLSQASFATGCYAILMGGSGNDSIIGAVTGVNYIFGDEGILLYNKEDKTKLERIIAYPSDAVSGNNCIIGGRNAVNYMFGGFGSDTIIGGKRTDVMFGDGGRIVFGGNNTFKPAAYDLFEEGGNDQIYGLESKDYIYAGAGADYVNGGDGDDVIYAGQGDDYVHGGSGDDKIYGDDGVDIIFGDSPNDGNMTIVSSDKSLGGVMPFAFASRDLTEKAKQDWSSLVNNEQMSTTSSKVVELYDYLDAFVKSATEESGMQYLYTLFGYDWDDLVQGVIDKYGDAYTLDNLTSEFRSRMKLYVNGTGTSHSDYIEGGNGSDIIFGDDGASVIKGHDVIKGGAGNDFIDGDNGNDDIDGGAGDDIIYGGQGNDILNGGADNDIVMGDDGWDAKSEKSGYLSSTSTESWFTHSEAKDIFGDTINAFAENFGLNQNAVSRNNGGDDTIIAGNGNDIVDGQAGDDIYKIDFRGGFYNNYTNVIESGDDKNDSMVVNGTILNDDVLIRASDVDLGLIALLPNVNDGNMDESANTRMERINYWKGSQVNGGIENVSINTGAGNDKIAIDSSLSTLNVDAGAGDDTITIGQVFESRRNHDDDPEKKYTNIKELDAFGDKNTETTQGYLSDGANYASAFNGGDGDDTFNMLHTSAAISLLGGAGDDNFNIASFSVEKNGNIETLRNAPVSVIGGVGDDTMTVNGTEKDDVFVYTKGNLYAPNLDIQAVGIENQNANGGNGDDEFYVLDTPKDSVYQLKGNNGNDSFYNGGIQIEGDAPKKINLQADVDPEEIVGIEVLFVCEENISKSLTGYIKEGGSFKYGIKLSEPPKEGDVVSIKIYVPSVSEEDFQRGNRGAYFVTDSAPYSSYVILNFTKDNYNIEQQVELFAPEDMLREGNHYFALLHDVNVSGTTKVNACKNVLVYLDEDTENSTVENKLVETLAHVITDSEAVAKKFTVKLNGVLTSLSDVTAWYNGDGGESPFTITSCADDNQSVEISWSSDAIKDGTRVFVHYRSKKMSTLGKQTIQFEHDASTLKTITVSGIALDEDGFTFSPLGNQIVLNNKKTKNRVTLDGAIFLKTDSECSVVDEQNLNSQLGDMPSSIVVSKNTIENIQGALFEDGAGDMNDFASSPMMLRYKELDKNDDKKEIDKATDADKDRRAELAKMSASFDESKSIDRVFVNNMDSNLAATSSLGSLDANKVEETEDSTKDEKKLITAETALLKSDTESLQLRHQASGSDVNKNISFGNMEYGEINLGTGEDTVDVNKSIYREDGFQTFTVVNSGKGGDTINVNSYKDGSDDQLVINAGEGDDHILATDAENVTKSGLIAFGGLGNDEIDIKSDSSLVFGDRGQVLYHDADGNVVTRLGDNKTGTFIGKENGVARNAGGSDYATGKKKGDEAYYQTDGTRYGATIARTVTEDQGGNDQIALAGGRNVVFGGTNDPAAVDKDNKPIVESVTTGNGEDLVFGDNGYTTFQGRSDVAKKLGMDNMPTIYSEATLSFNFQGPAQTGIAANEQAGAVADYTVKNVDETTGETVETAKHVEHHVGNWNNIKGHEAGTYGDNDDEIVLFDNGTRASAVSVSYGASEDHRVNTTDGDNIRLHGYTQEGRISANNSGDYNLMKSGLDTSGNNARNTLLAQVDGLDQYFTDYDVVVYLDMVQENSWAQNSVRVVTLYRDIVENGVARSEWVKSYYVNDPESNSFNGKWVVSTATTAEQARNAKDGEGNPEYANCVIFEGVTGDRFHVEITDGDAWNGYNNGKDRAGIAGIQVCGRLHRQDVAASTDIAHGGNDVINTQGGDDIVVGGTGADTIRTFGDDRYGIYDNDVVFGDNAKLSFTDRDGNLDTASNISYAESIASQNMSVSYDDKIMTGDGNDVVVGGSGSDKIDSGATAQADEKLDGLEVFSLNFTDVSTNPSTLISKGEAAGVVTDNDWHNAYLYNGDPRVHGTDSLGGIGFSYDCYGNTNAPAEVTNAKMDADTGNNKMMMNYVGGHNQDPLTVRLNNIRSKITAAKYDVYVYIDGINNDSDAHGYVFKITGSNGKSYYLNDWSGNRFDGDFKQVTCTDYTIGSLKDGITPSVEMIGNYVVFRDVESPNFDVTIECVDSNFGTQERNDLPVVSAVQIVAGANREKDVAVGGDHDKDFVAGDDASLHFDLDIPFAGDENIRDYQNRLISAKSMPVSGSANNDKIWTGKDRDVVVGGEGNDQIDAGAGDDVVIGNTARNLYVEHNNPVGVFRPNVNIVLEDNDYNVAEPRPYLDGQGGNRDQIRSMVQNGQIEGISLDYQNMANDTVYGGYNNKDLVFNGNVSWENLPKELASDPFFGGQEDEVHSLPVPSAPAENPVSGDEEPTGTDQPIGGGDESQTGGESGNGGVRTVVSSMAFANLDLEANERVKVVFEDYPKFADHIANLHLYFAGMPGEMFENVCVELYSHGRLYRYDVPGGYWFGVDVQDHIDADPALGDGNCVVYISSELATSFTVTIGE